ncbi:monothiol glutaredoxin-S11 [Senna tora]|uniref:Monothiol glutaredoxin-S11 n=1 Tax=Senna tora TaxID=362788 RepID=A0A834X787_9FABA|nr:monothiol glutaredoxin-S11 [Senna tora]
MLLAVIIVFPVGSKGGIVLFSSSEPLLVQRRICSSSSPSPKSTLPYLYPYEPKGWGSCSSLAFNLGVEAEEQPEISEAYSVSVVPYFVFCKCIIGSAELVLQNRMVLHYCTEPL